MPEPQIFCKNQMHIICASILILLNGIVKGNRKLSHHCAI